MELSLERAIEFSCYSIKELAKELGLSEHEFQEKMEKGKWEPIEKRIICARLHIPPKHIRDYLG